MKYKQPFKFIPWSTPVYYILLETNPRLFEVQLYPKNLIDKKRLVQSHQGPLQIRLRARDHIALRALSLVEKVTPVHVRFTLRLRDQRSKWMQGGCEVYWNPTWHQTDHVSWSLGLFPNTTSWSDLGEPTRTAASKERMYGLFSPNPLGVTPNPKSGDRVTPKPQHCCLF